MIHKRIIVRKCGLKVAKGQDVLVFACAVLRFVVLAVVLLISAAVTLINT